MLHSLYSFFKSELAQLDIFDCTKLFITLLKKALVQPFLFTLCHQFYMICSSKLIFNILAKLTKIRFSWRKKSNTTGKLEVNFKCQDWFEEVIWRFAVVKLNKAARLSEKVYHILRKFQFESSPYGTCDCYGSIILKWFYLAMKNRVLCLPYIILPWSKWGLANDLKVLGKTFWTFRNRPTNFLTRLGERWNSLKK